MLALELCSVRTRRSSRPDQEKLCALQICWMKVRACIIYSSAAVLNGANIETTLGDTWHVFILCQSKLLCMGQIKLLKVYICESTFGMRLLCTVKNLYIEESFMWCVLHLLLQFGCSLLGCVWEILHLENEVTKKSAGVVKGKDVCSLPI